MKKLFAVVLAVVMIVSVLSLSAFAKIDPDTDGERIDFLTPAAGAHSTDQGCSTAIEGDYFKITINVSNDLTQADIAINDATTFDASGYDYLQMYIDCSAINAVETLQMRLWNKQLDGGGVPTGTNASPADTAVVPDGSVDYYLFQNGNWEKYTVTGGNLSLPANYVGYIRINIQQFKNYVQSAWGNGDPVCHLESAFAFHMRLNGTEDSVGKTVTLGKMCFVKATSAKTGDNTAMALAAVVAATAGLAVFCAKKKKAQ